MPNRKDSGKFEILRINSLIHDAQWAEFAYGHTSCTI